MANPTERTLFRRLSDQKSALEPKSFEPTVVSHPELLLDQEVKKLENKIPPELKQRVFARFDAIRSRTFLELSTSTTAVSERIILKNGYSDVESFRQAADQMFRLPVIGIRSDFKSKPVSISQQLKETNSQIIKILKEISLAETGVEIMSAISLEHTLQQALETEEVIWRAERAGELDKLTGLMNDQTAATARFEIERQVYLEDDKKDEVMMWMEIDLDNFKDLNTQLGHPFVDANILKPLADRLRGAIRASSTDLICRFGGDEFSILFNHVKRNSTDALAAKIQSEIRKPFQTPKGEVIITASSGVLIIDKDQARAVDTSSPDMLMGDVRAKADVAAESSKRGGKNRFTTYSPDLKHFEASESVFIARFVRNNLSSIQRLFDKGKPGAADSLRQQLANLAHDTYLTEFGSATLENNNL